MYSEDFLQYTIALCPHLMLIFWFVKEVLLCLNYLCMDSIQNSAVLNV